MKKFNIKMIIMAVTLVVLITLTAVTYAAFSYKKTIVSDDVTVGDITINNKSFISYAANAGVTYEDTQEYYRLCKLRTDSVVYVEGITISANYVKVSISGFSTGVTYYTCENDVYSIATTYVEGTEYYIRSYNLGVKTAFDKNGTALETTINGNVVTLKNTSTSTIVEILTLTVENDLITSVGLNDTTNHRYVIGSDGLSVYVFTKETGNYTTVSTADTITCYASERKKNDSRIDYTLPYLNQLGLVFNFTVKIPVYIRIHIQDAWVSTQFLSSKSERVRYISKDKISGASPFSVTDDEWYYDAETNIAYLKRMFTPTMDSQGEFTAQEYIFNVNEGYFYHDTSAQAGSKVTTVQVSFTVDIVQANRAEALWNIDFDEIFG